LDIKNILKHLANGNISVDEAYTYLKDLPYKRLLNGICLDSHRELRTGHREVIFGQGKSFEQLKTILAKSGMDKVLITKLDIEVGKRLEKLFDKSVFYPEAKIFIFGEKIPLDPPWQENGDVIILTAGASDLPVALETYLCARFFDLNVGLITDVGVAGLHRLLPYLDTLRDAKILIVIAGMEGALPSVVGGITGKPILAVPTSVGYGASFNGISALLGMLNSCAGGVSVLNIDNGFGAALMAAKIFNSFKT